MERSIINLLSRCKQQNHRSMFIIPNINRNRIINKLYSLLAEKRVFLPECVWISGNKSRDCVKTAKKMKNNRSNIQLEVDITSSAHDTLNIPQNSLRSLTPTTLNKLLGSTVQLLIIENVLDPHVLAKSIETVQGNGMIILILGNNNIREEEYLHMFKVYSLPQDIFSERQSTNESMSPGPNKQIDSQNDRQNRNGSWPAINSESHSNAQTSFTKVHDTTLPDEFFENKKNFSLYNHRIFQSFRRSKSIVILNHKMKIINNPIDSLSVKDLNLLNKKFSTDSTDPLTKICLTSDQATTLSILSDTLLTPEKTLSVVTAARGRGKSALLGLAVARACTGQVTFRNESERQNHASEFSKADNSENIDQKMRGDPEHISELNDKYIDDVHSEQINMVPIISYKHIHVIAPFIENVSTIFEFLILGLNKSGFRENRDFKIIKVKKNRTYVREIVLYGTYIVAREKSTNEHDVNERHLTKRYPLSTISYHSCLSTATNHPDLLVIDEASSIPLSTLYSLLRANKVLLTSTVEGYEGTGRAIHHKFLKSFTDPDVQGHQAFSNNSSINTNNITFEKVEHLQLNDSIRYSSTDPIERWLNRTILIKSQTSVKMVMKPIEELKLFRVDKFGLFSVYSVNKKNSNKNHDEKENAANLNEKTERGIFQGQLEENANVSKENIECEMNNKQPNRVSNANTSNIQFDKSTDRLDVVGESLLKRIVSLFTTSHYRNTPGDLKILADTPNHHVFVLSDGVSVFCAAHIAIEEGAVNENIHSLDRRGNLIPWIFHDQYETFNMGNRNIGTFKGLRIVRLAVHPDYQGMGYGSETVRQILHNFQDVNEKEKKRTKFFNDIGPYPIHPLFKPIQPTPLDFIGVSLSLNPRIYSFFNKLGFLPIHLGQTVNQTGEFSCVMVFVGDKNLVHSKNEVSDVTGSSSGEDVHRTTDSHPGNRYSKGNNSYSRNRISETTDSQSINNITGSINAQSNHEINENTLFIAQLVKYHYIFKLKFLRMACPVWKPLGIEMALNFVTNDLTTLNKFSDYKLALSEFDRSRLCSFVSYQCDYSVIRDCLMDIAIFYFMNRGRKKFPLSRGHTEKSDKHATGKVSDSPEVSREHTKKSEKHTTGEGSDSSEVSREHTEKSEKHSTGEGSDSSEVSRAHTEKSDGHKTEMVSGFLLPRSQEIVLFSIGIFSLTPDQLIDQLGQINRETIVLLLRKGVKNVLNMI